MRKTLLAAAIALTVSAGSLAAAPAAYKEPLDAQTLDTIKSEFGKLMELANRHDFKALHGMFWQSPSGSPRRQKRHPLRGKLGRFLGQRGDRSEAARHRHLRPGRARARLLAAQGRRLDAGRSGILRADEYHGLICDVDAPPRARAFTSVDAVLTVLRSFLVSPLSLWFDVIPKQLLVS
jgi:hypothetical protein